MNITHIAIGVISILSIVGINFNSEFINSGLITNNRSITNKLLSNSFKGDDGKRLVPDNIIRMNESSKKAIKRSYKGNFIEIGDDKGSFIIINEDHNIAIEARESYIFSGFKVDDVYFIRSRKEFKYKPYKFILAVQNNEIKLFYSGYDGVLKDVSHYVEEKFQRFNLYFEGFDSGSIHLISIRGINNFQLRNLKEVNSVLAYIKLKK